MFDRASTQSWFFRIPSVFDALQAKKEAQRSYGDNATQRNAMRRNKMLCNAMHCNAEGRQKATEYESEH